MTNSSPDKAQIDKFKDAARELECDDDEGRFNARASKLIKPKAKDNLDQ